MIALKYNRRQCLREKMVHKATDARVSCRCYPMTLHSSVTSLHFPLYSIFRQTLNALRPSRDARRHCALKKAYKEYIGKNAFIKSHIIQRIGERKM